MSVYTTAANYGGRVVDSQQYVKQFFISDPNVVIWTYNRLANGLVVHTPADKKKPVLINNDLIVTGSIYNTSDEKLKENIQTITLDELDKLSTLNPIHFNFKNGQNKKKHYGILAQDVEKIFPELVENNNISGYKTVNYQELIPLMLAKIQNMEKEINDLKVHIK